VGCPAIRALNEASHPIPPQIAQESYPSENHIRQHVFLHNQDPERSRAEPFNKSLACWPTHVCGLYRRTAPQTHRNRKDATIAWLWPQSDATARALIDDLARVGRHSFRFRSAAVLGK